MNYLNNILAKIEAINGGCEEAIMLNAEGYVSECTGDNVFILKARRDVYAAVVGRGALRHHARSRDGNGPGSELDVSEPNLTRYDLFNADECF